MTSPGADSGIGTSLGNQFVIVSLGFFRRLYFQDFLNFFIRQFLYCECLSVATFKAFVSLSG